MREVEGEERWYQKQQDAIRRMDVEEDLRDDEEMQKRADVGRVRQEQIMTQMAEQQQKLAELKREGEMMKAMALADAEAEQQQRLEEMEREKRARAEVVEANNYLLKKRAEDQELQDAEEMRMLEYAASKEKDLLERRDREEVRFREVQAKAHAAREKLDEQRKNEMLVMHMSRQQQTRWKKERANQEIADDKHHANQLKELNV